ncbi:glutamate synthase large subunit [Adhaeribacter rhizoryzae]|uniref:Glutamate synthase [NADPH] large chain n=1 Tax=Adhaeribacter rhizoryzae TaxID=2607907 RepID=A0A5M6DM60_9BACT|nr:glutamate synthase large subunit [Adhaeribacter rhizoryzae]KAA5548611.1 glutamate synthase large subunit [Adhaeribacter rhizoryzae]
MSDQNNLGLYHPSFEHDSCGIGFVAHLKGRKSHDIVADALHMLARMEHRGACGCETNTGDGAGILIQVPHEFFVDECLKLGIKLPPFSQYGVGLVFFPQDEKLREECRDILNRNIEKLGMQLLGYRKLPTYNGEIGESALKVEPVMEHVFIKRPDLITNPEEFERKLFVLRNYTTRLIRESVALPNINDAFYIATLSYKTIVYKGQFTTAQVRSYFPDLQHKNVVSALAVVHSRFSTNTFPSFRLAQPFRYIAHNGEINTVKGNTNWMGAAEAAFSSKYFSREELDMILPICDPTQSDSANLDNVVELLTLSGRSLPHVMMMLIPEAWDGNNHMSEKKRAFYEYHAALMEPWDGPASISFTDGKIVGATLDRNGLRPSRYLVTSDDKVIMASEAGVLEVDPAKIVKKGRLQPGKMFVADLEQGRIISDEELKDDICSRQPYHEWLKNKIRLKDMPEALGTFHHPSPTALLKHQQAFGYTSEDLKVIIGEMAQTGKEPLGSMGTDTPLAILSDQSQHFSSYFKQLFAQVTNPPIDPIRERMVMSLTSYVGGGLNLLEESPLHCRMVELQQPVLSNKELEKIRFLDQSYFQTKTIYTYFKADGQPGSMEKAIKRICQYAADAVEDGFSIILLSDRSLDSSHAPIPSLLATSAVHHHLMRKGLRGKVGIVVECGDAWEVHHFATLISFGASAVNPYLAFDTIVDMKAKGLIESNAADEKLFYNYIKAINDGLLKVFSKMGISTMQSYQGAQIFEALGISKDVIDKYFTRTVSRIGGLTLDCIAKEALIKHKLAFPDKFVPNPKLEVGGIYQWKRRGEYHLFNPQTIHLLQQATRTNDYGVYKKYSKLVNEQGVKACTLRSLLKFKEGKSIPISEVEPVESIFKRFATGAMSFGSISHEAHTTLAIAMNRIGGKSNSGEGGEDEIRFERKPNGDWERSAIKQVASGRFGVTSYYLANADELQIKMAQGAKPGEGGQLPGHKVDEWIGRVRHSTPGVGLISPPPHHDIYSIEDLAQLIFDLKNSNPKSRINVKLVSEAGVGTVAAGVAKAFSDVVLISGYDGGTGASPISSIKHAGLPWELGLAEAHQTLVRNKLRSRIVVQADGQMKTGRDLAIAALLGAEEWGVATAALVTAGCIMMRKCHLNTCPVGVATQNPELRALFSGKPEDVVNLFHFLAEELREIMAELGFRTINEMVGQVDRLEMRKDFTNWKHKLIDLSAVLHKEPAGPEVGIYKQEEQQHALEAVLDVDLIKSAQPALENVEPVFDQFYISNTDRATGTMLSYEISKKYKGVGLPAGTIHYKFTGSAGQSFGAFGAPGIKFELEGEANDYFGKGLSGGQLILYPPKTAKFKASENIIAGNVAFYGATAGEAYIRGQAGERFCVRNSGAKAVVEGVGDHGCEYMTGGIAVILGETGRNFAAGMSGGIAYVYNPGQRFPQQCNMEMVEFDEMEAEDVTELKRLIQNHFDFTGSAVAEGILNNWDNAVSHFIKVMPSDYKKVLLKRRELKEVGIDNLEAVVNG